MVFFLQSLLLLFHFCVFLSQLSELVWNLAQEISLQLASKRFPSFHDLLVLRPTAIKAAPKNPDFAQIETQREQYIIDL